MFSIWILFDIILLQILILIASSGSNVPHFRRDPVSNRYIDVDECEEKLHNCPSDELCENLYGTFRCRKPCPKENKYFYSDSCHKCPDGYYIVNGTCRDLDECQLYPNMCKKYVETCSFRPGHSICIHNCTGNTVEINKRCYDIDECRNKQHKCNDRQKCRNTLGSYFCEDANCNTNQKWDQVSQSCQCINGYKFNNIGLTCDDINECENNNLCGQHGQCINLPGGYMCNCKQGYMFNNITCLDINECSQTNKMCKNLTCINSEGSYQCQCPTGYQKTDDLLCSDINECKLNPNPCQNPSFQSQLTCINFIGSFKCINTECDLEYRKIANLSRHECELIDPNCSYDAANPCIIQKPKHTLHLPIQLFDNYSVPKFLTNLVDNISQYNQYNIDIKFNNVIAARIYNKYNIEDIIEIKESKSLSIYLTKVLPVSTEIILDISIMAESQSKIQYISNTKLYIFSTKLNSNYKLI